MTTVKFIGLFVLMYTQNVGYQILMPHFTGMAEPHLSVIAYATADRTGGNWPGAQPLPGQTGWEYVMVDKQYITISGATDGVPNKVDPPHLTCCCTAMKGGIQSGYNDPNATTKLGAQISVTRGVASLVNNGKGRLDTHVDMQSDTGLTITGTLGANAQTILFKAGTSSVIFGNTPLCALFDTCSMPDAGDFAQYYKMAVTVNTCAGTPGNCSQCATSKVQCATSTCPTLASQRAKKPAAPKKRKVATINIDCSNSQWP